jgi:hypothetical protein
MQFIQFNLKTPVEISQLNTHLFDKSLNIDFIEVQNPSNFKHKNTLSLDHFLLKIGTISHNLIVIDEIKLDELHFALEQNANQVNLTQLLHNLLGTLRVVLSHLVSILRLMLLTSKYFILMRFT